MAGSRACDACAARKIRCDRAFPCKRCSTLSIQCTAARPRTKPGPRGPWAARRREARKNHGNEAGWQPPSTPPGNPEQHSRDAVPATTFEWYLEVFQEQLYPVWPIVDKDALLARLRKGHDAEAYMLAAAISAVTVTQLQLSSHDGHHPVPFGDGAQMAAEAWRMRASLSYLEHPSISTLLSSLFLHITAANERELCKAAFLLREAVTCAQLLGLHQANNYQHLARETAQLHLRIVWALFVTERGHSTRFDFPRILHLDPNLPALAADEENPHILSPFINLCRLFQDFGRAVDGDGSPRTRATFADLHARLDALARRHVDEPGNPSDLRRADYALTQQWMRLVLWKTSMHHVSLTTTVSNGKEDGPLSLWFPGHVAREVVQRLDAFPMRIVEFHGLGMEMKLFEIAFSLADVLLCLPGQPVPGSLRIGPRHVLGRLVDFLAGFRGGGDRSKLQLLYNKASGSSAGPLGNLPSLVLLPQPPDWDQHVPEEDDPFEQD
ncbi:hypothetical protein GE09DRAFT_1046052 [Coniochaeta sp. 2T2.1]|nr:hypothetical protein GE09DRAFT_1046052 [Coniochaeta sp. 2T2.1]